jgi:hypothetical protein
LSCLPRPPPTPLSPPPTRSGWPYKVYLAEEVCNVQQGDLSVDDYLIHQKVVADALAEIGAPVSNSNLVTNIIKGLDNRFDSIADIAPLVTPFTPSSTSATCCSYWR